MRPPRPLSVFAVTGRLLGVNHPGVTAVPRVTAVPGVTA